MILDAMVGLIFAIAMLAASISFARRRGTDPSSSSDQTLRVLLPAFGLSVGVGIVSFVDMLGRTQPSFIAATAIIILFVAGTAGLLMVAALEVAVTYIGARRTRAWLVTGIVAFTGGVAFLLLALASAIARRGLGALLNIEVVAIITLAAAAALIWWAYLPAPQPVASIFE